MTTQTVVQVDDIPYLDKFGSERLTRVSQQGDQAWFNVAIGDMRELRTLIDGVWIADIESQDSGL